MASMLRAGGLLLTNQPVPVANGMRPVAGPDHVGRPRPGSVRQRIARAGRLDLRLPEGVNACTSREQTPPAARVSIASACTALARAISAHRADVCALHAPLRRPRGDLHGTGSDHVGARIERHAVRLGAVGVRARLRAVPDAGWAPRGSLRCPGRADVGRDLWSVFTALTGLARGYARTAGLPLPVRRR